MGNFGLGIRVMFRIWKDAAFADQVQQLEAGKLVPAKAVKVEPKPQPQAPVPAKKAPERSEALTLLSVLQREARFIDFIKEPITAYSDQQIGAAVRDIHKGCSTVLERAFNLQPLVQAAEGSDMDVPKGFDPAQFRLTGNVGNEPPYRGKLYHHGWKAGKCELPEWTGSEKAALVIAPAEVEVK